MSIYKNVEYNDTPGVTVAEFGDGTVNFVTCKASTLNKEGKSEYRGLLLRYCQPREIGASEKTNGDFSPEIALIFNNKESFDVFKEEIDIIAEDFKSE